MTVRVGGQHSTITFLERRCIRAFSTRYNKLSLIKGVEKRYFMNGIQ